MREFFYHSSRYDVRKVYHGLLLVGLGVFFPSPRNRQIHIQVPPHRKLKFRSWLVRVKPALCAVEQYKYINGSKHKIYSNHLKMAHDSQWKEHMSISPKTRFVNSQSIVFTIFWKSNYARWVCPHLVSIVETRTNKFSHAAINHNEILCSIGFDSSDTIDKAASICNKWPSRFNNEIQTSRLNQFPYLQQPTTT